jgi:4'-phosphopantetheinyl transferase
MGEPAERFTPGADWGPAPAALAPVSGEVLLFLAPLDVEPERLALLLQSLSPRERARYESFAHEQHRFRWGAARGTLREILGRATVRPPEEIVFRYAPHGKPEVEGLHFNISHSGGLALLALGRVEVGVDVELPRRRRTDDIARRFFAPGEQERLFALPDAERFEAFFRLWTCKEAFLKATGEGLSRSLRSYEIDLKSARLLWAKGIPDAAERFSVHPLETGTSCRAALVAEGRVSLRKHRWP